MWFIWEYPSEHRLSEVPGGDDCNPRERIPNDESLTLSILSDSILETPVIQLSGVTQNFWQSPLGDLLTYCHDNKERRCKVFVYVINIS